MSWKIPAILISAAAAIFLYQKRKRGKLINAKRFCRACPKIELHYHLNGSIRPLTFVSLADSQGLDGSLILRSYKTVAVCFRLFSDIYKLVDSENNLRRLVRESLEDLWLDNVIYAEIRTTPRALDLISPEEYVRIVLDEISRFPWLSRDDCFKPGTLTVKLILSIDRAQSLETAWQTLNIALKFRDQVVGLDFGGNPFKAKFRDFRNFFEKARKWLPCTIHAAEILDEEDTDCILDFNPDRLGHFLLVNHRQFEIAKRKTIPIELCPTSNLKTLEIPGLREHPTIDRLIQHGMRFSINTDDTGVFNTTLSSELERLALDMNIDFQDIKRLQTHAVEMSFLPEGSKSKLKRSLLNDFSLLEKKLVG